MAIKLSFKKLSTTAKEPKTAYGHPAGIDLFADQSLRIPGKTQKAVKTGLAVEIRNDYYLEIKERSGLSLRTPLGVKAGIIDPDYRGEIKVILQNISDYPVDIDMGDSIAQLIIRKRYDAAIQIVENFETPDTERGEQGFGSSDT